MIQLLFVDHTLVEHYFSCSRLLNLLSSALDQFNFDYVDLVVSNDFAGQAPATYSLAGGTTLGNTQGDQHIAVSTILSTNDAARINSSDIDMIFSWKGKVHIITQYQVVTDSGTGTDFGIISISDKYISCCPSEIFASPF